MSTTVSATTSSSASSGDITNQIKAATNGQQLNENDFLTLFTTQLKYQDPTNPMQSYELASQLAQFTSVEQLTQLNSSFTKLQSSMTASTNAQMMNMIGKQVSGTSTSLQWKDGQSSTLSYQLDASSNVQATITDSSGNTVRTMSLGSQAAGSHAFTWDGKNNSGKTMAAGNYTCKLQSTDAKGNAADISTTASGQVYSFRLENGNPYLILNGADGVKLAVSDISEVTNTSSGG